MALPPDLDAPSLDALLALVHARCGSDFAHCDRGAAQRRIRELIRAEDVADIGVLQERVRADPVALNRLLDALVVPMTELFRDPPFWRAIRAKVVPAIRAQGRVAAWSAGCASGEEVHSLALVLEEEGLLSRSRLYATDINEGLVERARSGFLPIVRLSQDTERYQRAGGTRSLSDWYTARYDAALLRSGLRRNTVFACHNLANDASFLEFDLVLCRNVLIYFDAPSRIRALARLHESLRVGGFLGLGASESLWGTPLHGAYEAVVAGQALFRRRS